MPFMTLSPKLKLCLIDDDKLYLFGMKKMLELTKISDHVLEFCNGEEALTFFQTHHYQDELLPDVIFLDINMPVMNGWEFLEGFNKIKNKLNKDIVIYMVSSSMNQTDIDKARSFEYISQYLIKPVTLQQLKELFNSQAVN